MSLQVVTWLWGVGRGPFGPQDVNLLHRGLRRHLSLPFVFWCVTDYDGEPAAFDAGIRTYPMFTDHAEMSAGHRACFRRMRIFDRAMGDLLGPRILQLDLDVVFTDDVTPLFSRTEPLLMHLQRSAPGRKTWNPSLLLMDAGVLHPLWERFHAQPQQSWYDAKDKGWAGSDQAVINDYLNRIAPHGPQPATWTRADGVSAYWEDSAVDGRLPIGTRVSLLYGSQNPGDADVQRKSPWVLEHWV